MAGKDKDKDIEYRYNPTPWYGNESGIEHIGNQDNIAGSIARFAGNLKKQLELYEKHFQGMAKAVDDLVPEFKKVEKAASSFSKSMGLGGEAMKKYAKEYAEAAFRTDIGLDFGWGAEEMFKFQSSYADKIGGRRIGVSDEGFKSVAAMSNIMGDENANDMVSKLEQFGIALPDAGEKAAKMYKEAAKAGISFSKYSKTFTDNLELAQRITFKGGLKSLEQMAKKSIEIGLNISQASRLAEKLMTSGVHGAAEMGAKLQVLGGAFARLADPLGMLNEGLNDAESLQDRLGNMFKEMGHFNAQTGEIEISTFNKMRMRQAAAAMDLDYNEVVKSANRQAIRGKIEQEINMSNPGMSDKLKELLMNTGIIQNGKGGANINGEFYSLSEISRSAKLQNELVEQGKTDGEHIYDIAKDVRSIADLIAYRGKGIQNAQANYENGWMYNKARGLEEDVLNTKFVTHHAGMYKAYKNEFDSAYNFADHALGMFGENDNYAKDRDGSYASEGGSAIFKEAKGGYLNGITKFDDGGLVTGPSHANGGVPILGTNIEVEGGEFVVNKNAMKDPMIADLISSINNSTNNGQTLSAGQKLNPSILKAFSAAYGAKKNKFSGGGSITNTSIQTEIDNPVAVEKTNSNTVTIEKDSKSMSMPVAPGKSNVYSESNNQQSNKTVQLAPIDLNVNGTIKLEAPNGKNVDISEILKMPSFMREVSKMIEDAFKSKQGIYGVVRI